MDRTMTYQYDHGCGTLLISQDVLLIPGMICFGRLVLWSLEKGR